MTGLQNAWPTSQIRVSRFFHPMEAIPRGDLTTLSTHAKKWQYHRLPMTDPYVWYKNANITGVFVDGKWQTINMAYIRIRHGYMFTRGIQWLRSEQKLLTAFLHVPTRKIFGSAARCLCQAYRQGAPGHSEVS